MPRDTTTGRDYEIVVKECINRACKKNKMVANPQVTVGSKPGGGRHIIDWELISTEDPNRRGLLSCKIQSTGGTAEEKIAFEIHKLLYTMEQDKRYKHAWIVIGGDGWSESIKNYLKDHAERFTPGMKGKVTIFVGTDALLSSGIMLPE